MNWLDLIARRERGENKGRYAGSATESARVLCVGVPAAGGGAGERAERGYFRGGGAACGGVFGFPGAAAAQRVAGEVAEPEGSCGGWRAAVGAGEAWERGWEEEIGV